MTNLTSSIQVSEEMVNAGIEAFYSDNHDVDAPLEEVIQAIYLAMRSKDHSIAVDDVRDRVAKAISGAAYDYMRSIGFSGGWDHDELGNAIADAAITAIGSQSIEGERAK